MSTATVGRSLRRTSTVVAAAGLLAVSGAGVASATATAPAHATEVIANCRTASYEPSRIDPTCGDGTVALQHVTYSSWHAHSARGTGELLVDNCVPNCASGHALRSAVTLHFFRQRHAHGHALFTRLTVAGHRHGKAWHQTYYLPTSRASQ